MMSLNQKVVALTVVLLLDLSFFLFSPLLGVLALFASAPVAFAIVRQ